MLGSDSSIAGVATTVNALVESVSLLHEKVDQIHVLVNSNLTAANQSELAALESSVRLAKELIGLKRAAGAEPSQEAYEEIDVMQRKITELRTLVRDRLNNTEELKKE